ncbi:MAG: aminopeptidase [Bacteroidota bacterium]|nr:aminopeptidase [Bacteroidota bacterium]MDP3146580.1 aminopeptidase [Bacteroidota bacterium]
MLQRYKYEDMINAFRWLRVILSYLFFGFVVFCAYNYKTSIYLIQQSRGQISILLGTQSITDYSKNNSLSRQERENILLVEKIKAYSIDSLGYLPTKNFTTIYDQKQAAILWVITASEPYQLRAFEWTFPVVGTVTYKGFFEKELAIKEYNHLIALGYDVDMRSVSAWSTLGWFNDPLLSSMLKRSKGSLCNLLFHELFHATYYAPNSVNFNENIASFIAHKATIQYLQIDTTALKIYKNNFSDNATYTNYMIKKADFLRNYYPTIISKKERHVLKLKTLYHIADSINYLPLKNKAKFVARKREILDYKNAYFIDFEQYDSMQDTLEEIFNKIYRGNLKKLVQDLKQHKTIVKFDN